MANQLKGFNRGFTPFIPNIADLISQSYANDRRIADETNRNFTKFMQEDLQEKQKQLQASRYDTQVQGLVDNFNVNTYASLPTEYQLKFNRVQEQVNKLNPPKKPLKTEYYDEKGTRMKVDIYPGDEIKKTPLYTKIIPTEKKTIKTKTGEETYQYYSDGTKVKVNSKIGDEKVNLKDLVEKGGDIDEPIAKLRTSIINYDSKSRYASSLEKNSLMKAREEADLLGDSLNEDASAWMSPAALKAKEEANLVGELLIDKIDNEFLSDKLREKVSKIDNVENQKEVYQAIKETYLSGNSDLSENEFILLAHRYYIKFGEKLE